MLNAALEKVSAVKLVNGALSEELLSELKRVVDRCLEQLRAPSAAAAQTASGNTNSGVTEMEIDESETDRQELSTSLQVDRLAQQLAFQTLHSQEEDPSSTGTANSTRPLDSPPSSF